MFSFEVVVLIWQQAIAKLAKHPLPKGTFIGVMASEIELSHSLWDNLPPVAWVTSFAMQ